MLLHQSITSMLRLVREELGMDVTFVVDSMEGRRVFRHGDGDAGVCLESTTIAGLADSQQVLLRHPDGRVYGTLCCFGTVASEPLGERERNRLKMAASLLTSLLVKAESG